MHNVTRPRWLVFRLNVVMACDLFQLSKEFIDAYLLAVGDVNNLPDGLVPFRGQHVGINGVGDVGEIPRLLAIPVDHWPSPFRQKFKKPRDYAGVGRTRILARPKDIEVTKADRFEVVAAVKDLAV